MKYFSRILFVIFLFASNSYAQIFCTETESFFSGYSYCPVRNLRSATGGRLHVGGLPGNRTLTGSGKEMALSDFIDQKSDKLEEFASKGTSIQQLNREDFATDASVKGEKLVYRLGTTGSSNATLYVEYYFPTPDGKVVALSYHFPESSYKDLVEVLDRSARTIKFEK